MKKSGFLEIFNTFLLLTQILLLSVLIYKITTIQGNQNLTQIEQQSQNPTLSSTTFDVSVDDDPGLGNINASISIIEFSDFQCPFCKLAEPTIKTLMEKYPDQLHFTYRDFPLQSIHSQAFLAAEAANCSIDQDKYWEFHDALFLIQDDLSIDNILKSANNIGLDQNKIKLCIESGKYKEEINKDIADGKSYTVSATPTFFINGYKIEGVEQLESKILELLNKK